MERPFIHSSQIDPFVTQFYIFHIKPPNNKTVVIFYWEQPGLIVLLLFQ